MLIVAKFCSLSFVLAYLFFGTLTAAEIKTEFVPAAIIKKKYASQYPEIYGDCTLIHLIDWPLNESVNVIQTKLFTERAPKTMQMPPEMRTLCVDSIGFLPGHPVHFSFQSGDLKKDITIIPKRIFVKSPIDNAQIEAKLLSKCPLVCYELEFKGFGEREPIHFKSVVYDEVLEHKFEVNKTGCMTLQPEVINKPGGIDRVCFTRWFGEVLKLELPWGLEWVKYDLYFDEKGMPRSVINSEGFAERFPEIATYFHTLR